MQRWDLSARKRGKRVRQPYAEQLKIGSKNAHLSVGHGCFFPRFAIPQHPNIVVSGGDGKDSAKGGDYLQKAADAGSPTVAEEIANVSKQALRPRRDPAAIANSLNSTISQGSN